MYSAMWMIWTPLLVSSGVDTAELDREVKSIADYCVRTGRRPESQRDAALQWAKNKTQQIFPSPGQLPPLPREPFINPMAMAILAAPCVMLSVFILGPASGNPTRNSGIIVAGVVFWVAYIFVWILAAVWSKMHQEAVRRYWPKYDPHHKDRGPLERDLHRLLETAIREAWAKYLRPIASLTPQEVTAAPRAPLPWTPQGERPQPRASCTDREAEFLARDWMLYLGAGGSKVSSATRDGGMDVVSAQFVAEVKHHASPVPPSLVRQIFGVAAAERKRALFFSLSGYSTTAIEFATQTGIALFVYDYSRGTLSAKSPSATQALTNGLASLASPQS